ncbi:MAG: hypothetical protein NC249_08860 [Lachnoclostridium sp.]|nr:hypothetical protein [Lachnoclostridium sp.]
MSSINFNDYMNYANYDTGYDFSALMGGTTKSSGNLLSDYASIKNGSYGKLLKAYYAQQDAQSASTSGDSRQKLTLMRSSADSLKKSADALNSSSLWEKKKIKKKDEETGEETEVEDYDWDSITKAVKSFIEDYNTVVKQAGDSDTKNVLRNAAWMTGITDSVENLLSKVGITIGKGNQLELDEDALKEANIATLKSLFTGSGSFADKISQKAGSLSIVAANAAAKVKGTTYTSSGSYSDTLSKLVSSTLDEKVGDKDKSSATTSKTTDKKEDKKNQDTKSEQDSK